MNDLTATLAELQTADIWAWSLVAAVVVILVVAVLLLGIIAAANRIDRHALEIWEAGKKIAANTVSIWMLQDTNRVATGILESAQSIAATTDALQRKLNN